MNEFCTRILCDTLLKIARAWVICRSLGDTQKQALKELE